MSFFVTRPPVPVPATVLGSTPCSDAIRATTGETNVRPFPDGAPSPVGAEVACGSEPLGATAAVEISSSSASAGGAGGTGGASGDVGAGAGGSATAEPAGEITARMVPTSTVSPSPTRISETTPSPGLG